MRCQYVSGLLLQCKNLLPPNTSVPASTSQTSSLTENTNIFCEKHQSFIDTVKIHANVSRSALDPGFKIAPHLSVNQEVLLSTKHPLPSHVFEPCCSDLAAYSEENPLRNAGYMTDKEVVQQYNAALGRMINKVNDMRFIIYSHYMEHLKKKALVKEERRKYKICVRDSDERARLDRLKSDMAYARFNRIAATHLQKSYRKFKAEQVELRGRDNIKNWLEKPESKLGDMRCEFIEKVDLSTPADYVSPTVKNETNVDECVKAVLNALLKTIEQKEAVKLGRKQCNGRRIPMTDFCAEHLKLKPEIILLGKCKECEAPCLNLDNGLCNRHARTLFVPSPPPQQLSIAPVQSISQRLPLNKDRITRLPSMCLNTNSWAVNNRQFTHQLMMRDNNGFTSISAIRKPEVKYDISSLSGPLILKSRRPRDTFQKIIQGERQPNEALIAEQSKLKIENSDIQVWTIDEDVPLDELQKQCEARAVLDTTPTAPLGHQPKTKRSMLRLNGASGNVVIRGPIAIIQNPGVANYNSNIPISVANRNGKLNGMLQNGCARTRIYNRADRDRDRDRKIAHYIV